ncbi:MAG: molybdopterin molybdotransferase MoeA [Saezia sp.]
MDKDQKMTELDDAIHLILAAIQAVKETEMVPLDAACGRVLAQDILSGFDVPGFDNSAMDGYALNSADFDKSDVLVEGHGGKLFAVSQRIAAGFAGEVLAAGTVARIFTGAPVPQGADLVIQQEHALVQDDGQVMFTHGHARGDNIRKAGDDIQNGAVVIPCGKCMGVADIGLAASVGVAEFKVYRRPKVALFVTGDELTQPGEALKPGAIYNSNQYVLRELLHKSGCEVSDLGIIRDSLPLVEAHLKEAAKTHDLILTSGGVSVGEEDHVKHAVQNLGELKLWKLAFKPGKPLAFGQIGGVQGERGAWFLGLPGNPVASFVTFLMVVLPFLQKMSGRAVTLVKPMSLQANFAGHTKGRREFWRARINDDGRVDLYPNQSSGVLTSMAWGQGFVDAPAHTDIKAGDTVRYIPFSSFLEL